MNRFDKIIQEALSFSKTFKAPASEDIEVRRQELIDDIVKYLDKTKLPDGTWLVDGGLNISGEKIKSFKGLNISKIDGYFACNSCGLESLEYGPKEVTGSYNCSFNPIKNFKGVPKYIGGSFSFENTHLTSLEGFPKEIVGHVYGVATHLDVLTDEMIRDICNVHGRVHV